MKAILITKENQNTLMGHFARSDQEDLFPIGYYLITDFGNDEYFDTITVEMFNQLFNNDGAIKNGWIAISRK